MIAVGCVIGAVLLAIFVALLVATFKPAHSSSSSVPEEKTTSVYEREIGWDAGVDEFVPGSTADVELALSNKQLAEFEAYLKGIDVNYDYEDEYHISEALAVWDSNDAVVSQHKHDVRVNGVLDADEFYRLVKKNNKAFLASNESTFHKEYSAKKTKEYCKLLIDAINDIHSKNPELDFDSVCCYLYDLKVLDRIASLDFAAVNLETKVFHLNEDSTNSWGGITHNDEFFNNMIYHEAYHIYQVACECNTQNGELRFGINHEYDELDVNSLCWYWLVEASAEMNACELLNIEYGTYHAKIGYVDTLNYILSLSGSNETANIQDINFTHETKKIFELFDMTDKDDMYELIEMMYSIEIIQQKPTGFFDWFEEKYNIQAIEGSQELLRLRLTVKEDALLTLTKLFYRNLAREINNGGVTLRDAYYLIRVFEADIDRHMSNQTVGYLIFFKDFYGDYLDVQNEFFAVLSKDNNVEEDKLSSGFQAYSMNINDGEKDVSPNCTLNFLTNEQRRDVVGFCESFYKKGYPSMKNADVLCKQWLEKAPYDELILDD